MKSNVYLLLLFVSFIAGTCVVINHRMKHIEKTLNAIYEKGYINGFRKARSYEIKDTMELNNLYPNLYYLKKYGNDSETEEKEK